MLNLDFSHHPKIPLAPGCPWEFLTTPYPPNVKWCEESLFSWIAEPALTWSNLAFFAVGLFMIYMSRKEKRSGLLFWFGPAALLVGTGSGIYHASINFWTQLLDFFVMYVFCFLIILASLRRLHLRFFKIHPLWILVASFGLTGITVILDQLRLPFQATIAILITAVTFFEIWVAYLDHETFFPKARSPYFMGALFSFILGISASGLDVSRIWCDPHNHWLQGHAIWHLFSSVGLVFAFFHYRQASHRI